MMDAPVLGALLAATWRLATPLVFAALGELLIERSGLINIGLEGMMLLGAYAGFAVGWYTGSAVWGVLGGALTGVLSGLIFAWLTVTLKANQIVVGAAMNMLAVGLTGFLFRAQALSNPSGPTLPVLPVPGLSTLPVLGEALLRQNALVYLTGAAVGLVSLLLYRTGFGLAIRAAGDNPGAATAAGISVPAVRYTCVMLGAGLAAIGGAYLTLAYANQFVEDIVSGRGFIALAVVVFGRWSPRGVLAGSLLFGLFYALQLRLQAQAQAVVPYQLLQALPYLATLVALVGWRRSGAAPRGLGHL